MNKEVNLGKCDMQKPFVFVSYSKKDKDLVHPLVAELQSEGYNIWIDKELSATVGKDWQEGALAAIADLNCKALLFMVSSNSLTSAPVYAELAWSQSETTCRNNEDKPMQIITINADKEWIPAKEGIEDWIKQKIGVVADTLVKSDYDSLDGIEGIPEYYYNNSLRKLKRKGEIAHVIYKEILLKLGGSKITFASINEIDTIVQNIPDVTKIGKKDVMKSGIESANKLSDGFKESKAAPVKSQPVPLKLESPCDDSITIGDISKQFEDGKRVFVLENYVLSGRIEQILAVLIRVDTYPHPINDYSKAIGDAWTEVAVEKNVTKGTIADKCTRQLGLNTEMFKELVMKADKGDNTLMNIMLERKSKNDDETAIKNYFASRK